MRALSWFERANDGDADLEIGKIHLRQSDRTMALYYLQRTTKAKNVTQASKEEAQQLVKTLLRQSARELG